MKLYLVRHGETDANRMLGHGVSGPTHNQPVTFKPGDSTNISLNIIGRENAMSAARDLPDHIDKLYSSPLLRVKETAEIIAAAKNIDISKIEFRDELVEYYQGTLEGFSYEEKKKMLVDQNVVDIKIRVDDNNLPNKNIVNKNTPSDTGNNIPAVKRGLVKNPAYSR